MLDINESQDINEVNRMIMDQISSINNIIIGCNSKNCCTLRQIKYK